MFILLALFANLVHQLEGIVIYFHPDPPDLFIQYFYLPFFRTLNHITSFHNALDIVALLPMLLDSLYFNLDFRSLRVQRSEEGVSQLQDTVTPP